MTGDPQRWCMMANHCAYVGSILDPVAATGLPFMPVVPHACTRCGPPAPCFSIFNSLASHMQAKHGMRSP
eukprot:15541973-Heterocapsa_arctica.AAC.1